MIPKNDYVNKKEFYALIEEYNKSKSSIAYNKIGKMFMLIAKNLLNKPCFINYTQDRKDEMISDAVFAMVKYMHNFDLEKSNPFAYFTMIAWNAYLQYIKRANIKEEKFVSLDLTENLDYSGSTSASGD